jgi:hypothetical protein
MLEKLEKIFVILICTCFVVLVLPVGATDYAPGVHVGDSVVYESIVASGAANYENLSATEWIKMEVTLVMGNRVTVHTSRMMKETWPDTREQDGSDYVFDVSTNETDRSSNPANLWNNYFLVAGNLSEGSDTHQILQIPEGSDSRPAAILINKTETKDILGMNRMVNVVDYHYSNSTYYHQPDYRFYAVYDYTTGMLLELNCSLTSRVIPGANEETSYSAIEINTKPRPTDYTLVYTGVAVTAVIILAGAYVLVLRRRRKPQTPTVKKKIASRTRNCLARALVRKIDNSGDTSSRALSLMPTAFALCCSSFLQGKVRTS